MDQSTISTALIELFQMHLRERALMHAQRHAEHQACVDRKMAIASQIDSALAAGAAVSAADRLLISKINDEAQANAMIAQKMLALAMGKIEYIRRQTSPSYGSDGRMRSPTHSGSLLDLKA